MGITANVMDRVEALNKAHVDVLVIDSAHGHSANIFRTLKEIKAAFPELQVIAGNVATAEAYQRSDRRRGGRGESGYRTRVDPVPPVWWLESAFPR